MTVPVEAKSGRPPFGTTRVLKASRVLPAAAKLAWLEHYALDGADGCYMGAGPMAARLGWGRERVEEGRRQLVALGLLTKRQAFGRRTASWYTTFPADCIPATREPKDAEILALAILLDGKLSARATGMPGTAIHSGQMVGPRPPITAPTGGPDTASPAPTGGLQTTTSGPNGRFLPASEVPTSKQVGIEVGADRSRDTGEDGTEAKGVTRKAGNLGHDIEGIMERLKRPPARAA